MNANERALQEEYSPEIDEDDGCYGCTVEPKGFVICVKCFYGSNYKGEVAKGDKHD